MTEKQKTKRTKIKHALESSEFGTGIVVKGWVRTKRGNKNVNFIALNDGSTINNLQPEKMFILPSPKLQTLKLTSLYTQGHSPIILLRC